MNNPVSTTDQAWVARLQADDNDAVQTLYQRCYPAVERYVLRNSGSTDEARDLFQDTALLVLTAIRKPDFVLTCSLKTYVVAISKNLWLKHLRESARWRGLETLDETTGAVAPDDLCASPTAWERVRRILSKLTTRCQALLTAIFLLETKMTTIVRDNGYANAHTAQNQKYKCLEQARKETRLPPGTA